MEILVEADRVPADYGYYRGSTRKHFCLYRYRAGRIYGVHWSIKALVSNSHAELFLGFVFPPIAERFRLSLLSWETLGPAGLPKLYDRVGSP